MAIYVEGRKFYTVYVPGHGYIPVYPDELTAAKEQGSLRARARGPIPATKVAILETGASWELKTKGISAVKESTRAAIYDERGDKAVGIITVILAIIGALIAWAVTATITEWISSQVRLAEIRNTPSQECTREVAGECCAWNVRADDGSTWVVEYPPCVAEEKITQIGGPTVGLGGIESAAVTIIGVVVVGGVVLFGADYYMRKETGKGLAERYEEKAAERKRKKAEKAARAK